MMGLSQFTLAIVLATFTLSNAFHTLVPQGKEVVYNYRALVKAGTHYPAPFASGFLLYGQLHVQSDPQHNITHARLSGLKYVMYNGKVDHHKEHHVEQVPVGTEVEDLEKVFKIVHNSHGNEIVTEKQEKEFSRNIKKSIAAIMQLDVDSVMDHPHHVHAFTTTEHSLYGMVKVHYTVLPQETDVIKIKKIYDMQDHVETQCTHKIHAPVMKNAERKYTIVKEDGHQIVKKMQAFGSMLYVPYNAKSDSQYMVVNQTFVMEQITPIKEQMSVKTEHHEQTLTYHMYEQVNDEIIPDSSNGRHIIDYQKLTTQVHEMLKNMVQYLKDDHINTKVPDIEQGQAVNRIQRTLMQFDLQHLEEVHSTLKQQTDKDVISTLSVFHHILPVVGTKASMMMIKKLIVEKLVEDHVAVTMLQNMGLHVIVPHDSMLKEMEPLMHLGDNISWSVKKTGIMTFGTLVNKVYEHKVKIEAHKHVMDKYEHVLDGNHEHGKHDKHHNQHEIEHVNIKKIEEDYEKYVIQYVQKMKESKDLKEQIVYINGLQNMKMEVVVKHLKPVVMGEWTQNRSLRFMSLIAMSAAIGDNEDLVTEIFWPIFVNHDEPTEIRTATYYFIMETKPSNSLLLQIGTQMMNEPDDEVYCFHYTYVQAMSQSMELCHKDFSYRLAKVLKMMHPPSHGVSFVYTSDYQDINHGFGGGFRNLFISTNVSQIFAHTKTLQHFHHLSEDYTILVKLNNHKVFGAKDTSFQLSEKLLTQIPTDSHLEVTISKHNFVISTYYIDQNNMDEVKEILEFFTKKDKTTMVQKTIEISYEKYLKFLMPTDMGIPAVWDFLMPMVQTVDINSKKEFSQNNNVIYVNMDNHYTHWVHARHGLTFYNPITDVWQGINRYHSHDMVVPMKLDITVNALPFSVKLSWEKHQDQQRNVMGLRSHVVQMVFVKDVYQRDLLKKTSPQSQEWTIVSNGEHFTNDYVLVDEDDVTTGTKLQVVVYDSEHHVSNGSHQNVYHHIAQPWTKNFDDPMAYLSLVMSNWHQYLMLLPKPGAHGVMIKAEPSPSVTNIDLNIRANQELVNRDYIYAPAVKYVTRVTYAVKNKEQSLKTWDVNAILDMNAGHTVNNLKMHLTRIVPGQQDYKICVDGVKKWTNKDVTGHVNVAMSQTADGKCVKDDTVIDVTMVGQKSHEQKDEQHIYGSCQYPIPYVVPEYHTLHCLVSQTTVRQYTYNVKTTNVPSEFRKVFWSWWDQIKGYYMWFYTFHDEHNENISENNMKIDVLYPMDGNQVDIKFSTPQHQYELSGIPTHNLPSLGVVPDSLVYPREFLLAHDFGILNHCHIHLKHHHVDEHPIVHKEVPKDWTLYVADTVDSPKQAVYVKQTDNNKIAVKIVHKDHTVEVLPQTDEPKVVLNGQEITTTTHNNDWMSYFHIKDDADHTMVIMMHQIGMHLEIDDDQVVVVTPNEDWHGQCYKY